MAPEFGQHEREVERQFARLRTHLRDMTPSAECLANVKAAVDAEARRLRVRERRVAVLRPWLAAAAAVLLASGLNLPRAPRPQFEFDPGRSPDAIVADWVDALAESGEQFAGFFEADWLPDGYGSAYGGNGDDDGDPLETLEESLESFERMIGI